MKHIRVILSLLLLLILGACSTTRRIEDGEQLYTGVKRTTVTGLEGAKVPEGVDTSIRQAVNVRPNNCLISPSVRYPFPLGLWVYNNWPNPPKGFKHWIFEKLAAEPVLISDVRPDLRTKMIDQILEQNGYFRGSTDYTVDTSKKNAKKASVSYTVSTGPAFLIDTVEILPDTCALNHAIDSLARRDPYLQRGQRYCTDSLQAVRTRIANSLRNQGYYFFRPNYIEYLADTIQNPLHIALRMTIPSGTPPLSLQPFRVGRVTTIVNRYQGGGTPDTIQTSRGTLVKMMPQRLRNQVIPECVALRSGRMLSIRDINRTQTALSRLGIFSGINIVVHADTASIANRQLDVTVNCTFDTPLEARIELNASSKSNSYIGPGALLGVTNRNLFGGGEQLSVTLTGSYEWQTGRNRSSVFNSYEIGVTGSLAFPRLLAPRFIPRSRRQLNWTRISLNAELLNRPHFFRMAQFNASFSYDWQSSRHTTQTFTPLKITYTRLLHTTAHFDSLMNQNEAIAQSFKNQFIPQFIYNYTYDRDIDRNNHINIQAGLQEAGNVCWALWRLAGVKGEKKLFGMPFSQFVKGSLQVVYSRRLGYGDHWLVMRGATGAAHAYGNSSQVPYSEQFWVGGANSIRAFTVRSIGPGSYHAPSTVKEGYFDQTGTFKFEANVEYRFPLIGPLHGALFVDAGNVWLLRDDPQRPGGQLKASTFLRDLALGTGAGLRFDIGMLVLRADLGIGLHAPWDTGKSGYYNMTSFRNSLAFHLAIGYPF